MVNRSRVLATASALGGALLLSACDPFAPSEPEAPSSASRYPLAASDMEVDSLFRESFNSRNLAWNLATLEGSGTVSLDGAVLAKSLDNCSRALLAKSTAGMRFSRVGEVSRFRTDSTSLTVEYAFGWAGADSLRGKTVLKLVPHNIKDWRLKDWNDDPNYPRSLARFCKGEVQ